MPEGYHCRGEGDCSYSWLDEWLCEYVDGTMDPAVRKSFEEYLTTDPALARQVERLRCTRTLLCLHGCQMRAPDGLQARVRRRLALEMLRTDPPFFVDAVKRLGVFAAFASLMGIMLMTGMLVGAEFSTGDVHRAAEAHTAPPDVTRQEMLVRERPPAVTPLPSVRPPVRLPRLADHAAPVPPAAGGYLMSRIQDLSGVRAERLGLQRTGVVP